MADAAERMAFGTVAAASIFVMVWACAGPTPTWWFALMAFCLGLFLFCLAALGLTDR